MKIVVFAGPSISKSAINLILPDAQVFPPIKRGSLLSQNLNKGDIVIIIDGFFQQKASIQHMEIIDCIQKGITIIGCSSMGALRAAELNDFGVIGVGYIYQMYRYGLITGDDEVGILHDSENYDVFSDALIDIRLNLKKALDNKVIDELVYLEIINFLKNQWFGSRSYSLIFNWIESQYDKNLRTKIENYINNNRVNIKYEDAIEALKLVKTITKPNPVYIKKETGFLNNLKNEYSFIAKSQIRETDIINYCRLFDKHYPLIYKKCVMMGTLILLNQEYQKYIDEATIKLKGKNLYCEWLKKNDLLIEDIAPHFALNIYLKRENKGCLLTAFISELKKHGYIKQEYIDSDIDYYLYQILIQPGIPWVKPLTLNLKMRGIFNKIYRILEKQNSDFTTLGELTDKNIINYYLQLWGGSEKEFSVLLKERRFNSLSHFLKIARNPLYLRKLGDGCEFKKQFSENV